MGCNKDSNAQGTDDAKGEITLTEASATVIDSPQPEQKKPIVSAEKPRTVAATPPQDTLRPKSIQMIKADAYLKNTVQDEASASQIRTYLEQDEKVSAVRAVSKMTKLELPEAKAFIDSLDVLMGTDKVTKSPVLRRKSEKK